MERIRTESGPGAGSGARGSRVVRCHMSTPTVPSEPWLQDPRQKGWLHACKPSIRSGTMPSLVALVQHVAEYKGQHSRKMEFYTGHMSQSLPVRPKWGLGRMIAVCDLPTLLICAVYYAWYHAVYHAFSSFGHLTLGHYQHNLIPSCALNRPCNRNLNHIVKSPRREVVRSSAGASVVYPPFLGSFA